jgi:hypothetical protein
VGRSRRGLLSVSIVVVGNAMCESFFATLECEMLAHCRFKTRAEARSAVFAFIEGFYNPRRRHSSIGYLSPIDYERRHHALGGRSRPTSAWRRARDRQGQALRAAPRGPSLTAAARDGRTIVRVGTEEWLRRGPNQRMA